MSAATETDPFAEQMDQAAEFLSHYGVKGMKWGVRKKSGGVDKASKSGAVKEAPSEDAAKVGDINSRVKAQKSTKMLSNKELQAAIERMRLEQQYSQMTGGLDKTKKQKAQGFIREMIGNTVKGTQQSAQNILNKEVTSQMDTVYKDYKKNNNPQKSASQKSKKPKQPFGFAA